METTDLWAPSDFLIASPSTSHAPKKIKIISNIKNLSLLEHISLGFEYFEMVISRYMYVCKKERVNFSVLCY